MNINSAMARLDRNYFFRMVSQTRVDASFAYASNISDDAWYLDYESEFSSPDPELEQLCGAKLEEILAAS